MPGCAKTLRWLYPAGVWLAAAFCQAQEPGGAAAPLAEVVERADQPAGEARPAAARPALEAEGDLFDIRYLEGPDGRPVFVPDKVRLDEFLNWLEQRKARAGDGPPGVSVSSLSLEGTADEDRALFTARVALEVSTENSWVRAGLQMSEAALRAVPVHTGDGIAVPVPFHPEEGYAWWIRGKGKHELSLSLSIPLRKQPAQRRLQLSLPATAVSLLKLRVASPRVSVKGPERSTVSTKAAGRETEIEVIGLGNHLDLTWQTLPESSGAATALEVTTSVVATLVDGEAATLEAMQLIQSLGLQGTFEELRVSLPAGYELLRLEGQDHREHKIDPANPHQVVVQLKKPTSGPVELKWTVRSKLPAVGEPFALEGFEVDRAGWQRGFLAVVVVGDFRIVRLPDEDKFLQRVDLADLPGTLRQTPARAGYRFLNRLLLRMKLQRIEPFVTVDPALLLHLSSDSLELEASYRLQVLRGSIGSLRLRWPKWNEQGWTIADAELAGHVELQATEEPGDPDVVRLEFAEPAKGAIDLRFRARRPLTDVAERTPLSLPISAAYGRFPTPLAVVSADNVEADLRSADATLLRPVGLADPRIPVPDDWRILRRTDYRIESPQADLTLGLAVHPRKIVGTTRAEVSIRRSAVTVRQKIVFDVAYERIAQLRFAIPEGVPPEQLKFFSNSGKELVSQVAPSSGRSPAEIRVTLDVPAIGRLEIEARYALGGESALPDSDETVLSIPLLQSNDVVFSSTRLSCRDAAGRDALVEGEGWIRQLAPDGLPVWVLAQARAQVPVRVAHSGGPSNRSLISKTLILTNISVDGTIRSRAQYKTAEGISEMTVSFSPHLEPVAFWWNRRELRVGQAASSRDGTTYYEILVPDRAAASERLLTIDFIEKAVMPARLGMAYTLDAPRLSEEQIAAEVRWQVELPFHQHLFTEPAGFSPEYRWRSGRLFWSREPESSTVDLEQWIGAGAGPGAAFGSAGGNRYVFGAFGPPPQLDFQAMSQSGIVLMGAGTALILGWVLLYWPAARHVLTFLSVAFLVSLLAVWFAAPVQVLVQPAVVGVALAVLGAAIQGFLKRRARPVTVTLTSPSGFLSRPSSHPKSPVVGVGSNEFTALRPQLEVEHPAEQLSESGNRT